MPVRVFTPDRPAARRRRGGYPFTVAGGGSSLASGSASFVSSGPAGISVVCTAASGGTAPYTYQWQRNSNGGAYSNLSGATSLSLNDTTATTVGVLYGFKCVATDSASATVPSNAVTAQVYTGGAITGGVRTVGAAMGVF